MTAAVTTERNDDAPGGTGPIGAVRATRQRAVPGTRSVTPDEVVRSLLSGADIAPNPTQQLLRVRDLEPDRSIVAQIREALDRSPDLDL